MVNTGNIALSDAGYTWYPTYNSYYDGFLWQAGFKENFLTELWRYTQPEYLSMLEMRTTEESYSLRGIVSDMLDSPAPPAYEKFYNNVVYIDNYTVPTNIITDNIIKPAYDFGYVDRYLKYTDRAEDVFVDPANGNFFLKEDSRAYRDIIGFEKWDYSLIGPRK